MQTGRRVWQCELSTIDTAILLSGMLVAAQYFDQNNAGENEAGQLVEQLNQRVDWNWARNHQRTVTHGLETRNWLSAPSAGKVMMKLCCCIF